MTYYLDAMETRGIASFCIDLAFNLKRLRATQYNLDALNELDQIERRLGDLRRELSQRIEIDKIKMERAEKEREDQYSRLNQTGN